MSPVDALALCAILITLAAIPSTSVALVVARSATLGFSSGAAVSFGIVLGDLLFVFLAIFGLAALAELMGTLFLIVKYLAGAYLIWFGFTLLKRTTNAAPRADDAGPGGGLVASFLAGLLVTLGDVKAIFFYASLFPAFVDMATLSATDVLAITLVTIVTVGGVKLAYALGANRVARLSSSLKIQREARMTAGGLMLGAGAYLIAKA